MPEMIKGANAPIAADLVNVTLEWASGRGTLDSSAYLLAANGRVRGDADMIFYNQREDSTGAIKVTSSDPGRNGFAVDLARMPAEIASVVFCLTVENESQTIAAFNGLVARISSEGLDLATFRPELDGATEAAIKVIELYRRNSAWKVRAIAQGFNGGLGPLATAFGIDVAEPDAAAGSSAPIPSPPASPAPASTPSTASGPPSAANVRAAVPGGEVASPTRKTTDRPVSLAKIVLDDEHPSTSLQPKQGRGFGEVTVSLNWTSQTGGLFGRPRPLRLQLGCLFELADETGRCGAVQALGGAPGQLDAPPFIALDRDTTGDGVRRLKLNGDSWAAVRRVAVFAFIDEGAPDWRSFEGTVTIGLKDQLPIEFAVSEGRDGHGLRALALLENVNSSMAITRSTEHFPSHIEYDQSLGFGLTWRVAV